ncbi:MAG: hypothetical protein R2710_02735 [Acidimicrobiales bacterium]
MGHRSREVCRRGNAPLPACAVPPRCRHADDPEQGGPPDPAELHACTADLERLLHNDGIAKPSVFPVSATTGQGVDAVLDRLADTVAAQRAMVERLSADVATAADTLAEQVPPPPHP